METPAIPPPPTPTNDSEQNKDIAALSYAWVLSVFIFFWKRDSAFVHFHAKQGLVLFGLSIVFWMIPIIGRLLELAVLACCVLGFLNAASGKQKSLPIVGDIALGQWGNVRTSWKNIVASVGHVWHRAESSATKDETTSAGPTPPPSTPPTP